MQIPESPPLNAATAGDRTLDEPLPAAVERVDEQVHAETRDTVSLTEKGREYRQAIRQAHSLPDVRMDRVEQLRRQLAEGTYRIRSDRVAADMMDETLENNTVLTQIDLKA